MSERQSDERERERQREIEIVQELGGQMRTTHNRDIEKEGLFQASRILGSSGPIHFLHWQS